MAGISTCNITRYVARKAHNNEMHYDRNDFTRAVGFYSYHGAMDTKHCIQPYPAISQVQRNIPMLLFILLSLSKFKCINFNVQNMLLLILLPIALQYVGTILFKIDQVIMDKFYSFHKHYVDYD